MKMKGVNGRLLGELTLIFAVAAGVFVLSSALVGARARGQEEEQEAIELRGDVSYVDEHRPGSVDIAVQKTTPLHVGVSAPLPAGWLELETEEGATYYYNEESEVSGCSSRSLSYLPCHTLLCSA